MKKRTDWEKEIHKHFKKIKRKWKKELVLLGIDNERMESAINEMCDKAERTKIWFWECYGGIREGKQNARIEANYVGK